MPRICSAEIWQKKSDEILICNVFINLNWKMKAVPNIIARSPNAC